MTRVIRATRPSTSPLSSASVRPAACLSLHSRGGDWGSVIWNTPRKKGQPEMLKCHCQRIARFPLWYFKITWQWMWWISWIWCLVTRHNWQTFRKNILSQSSVLTSKRIRQQEAASNCLLIYLASSFFRIEGSAFLRNVWRLLPDTLHNIAEATFQSPTPEPEL
jgi:hypothetical protein